MLERDSADGNMATKLQNRPNQKLKKETRKRLSPIKIKLILEDLKINPEIINLNDYIV